MSILDFGNTFDLFSVTTIKSVARIITEIRDCIAEPEPERFSDSMILRFLNRAHEKVYNDIGTCFKRDFFTTSTLDMVKDQERYSLPTDYKRMYSVVRTKGVGGADYPFPEKLNRVNYHERAIYRYGLRSKETYYFIGNKLGILPIPQNNETASITIEYFPRVSELTASGEIDVDSDYSLALVLYASFSILESEEGGRGKYWRREYEDVKNHIIFDNSQKDEGEGDFIRAID